MKDISCKLLVIGAGPGGYVCAIRAAQLGVDTVIVDASPRPGGTCLNVGCIPSKALIHAADEFAAAAERAGGNVLGISAGKPQIDLAQTMEWKDGITTRLASGVSGLLKKAGVKRVTGPARFRDGRTVEVETDTGVQVIYAENVVIATGSAPAELAAMPFGGRVISSSKALALKEVPATLAVRRCKRQRWPPLDKRCTPEHIACRSIRRQTVGTSSQVPAWQNPPEPCAQQGEDEDEEREAELALVAQNIIGAQPHRDRHTINRSL